MYLFIVLEGKLMKHIKFIIVFDEVMEDLFSSFVKIKISFICEAHRGEVLARTLVYIL